MTATDSFTALVEQFHSDGDAAAREVFLRFSGRLIVLARRRFDPRLAHRVDPEDVVQSAFKSFFARHRDGKLQIGGWQNVWALLVRITLCKCADRVEYLRAGRRDIRREVIAPDGEEVARELALDREPSPDEAAALAETVEALFRALDADERPVLELSLQGHSAAEIGLKLGRAVRTVHRIRERIHKRLWQLHAGY
jgi:RNA polymerase sigma-70 factor, ECF subfamily